jgi:2-aminoadipate transaminase
MKLSTARRMQRMKRSTIREILKLTKRPGIISFAGGLPTPELFPIQEFKEALQTAMEKDPVGSLQYDVTEGYRPLKEWICGWLTRQGFRCTPEEMMLTNGSQQALDLLGKIFLDPGDCVLVEDPTYLGAIQAFNAYEPKYTTVPMDDQGILPEDFAAAARKSKPKFAYLVPTFQNPSGVTLNLERRKKILALARKNHLPIIEDDPYGYLRFSGTPVPSMYALSRGKGVIYLSTLSKILSPGIRVGFVLAEPKIINALVLAKQAADLQPNSLIQRAVYHYAQAGHFERHIPKIIMAYGERAKWMLDAIRTHFPRSIQAVVPEGGMFIWCRLPKKLSATALFPKAIKANVAYVTGSVFYANGGGHQALRLNFTNSTKEQIETGIERLGTIFNNHL